MWFPQRLKKGIHLYHIRKNKNENPQRNTARGGERGKKELKQQQQQPPPENTERASLSPYKLNKWSKFSY